MQNFVGLLNGPQFNKAKSNFDSRLLFLSCHSNSFCHRHKRVRGATKSRISCKGYTGDCSCLLLNAKIWPRRRTRGRGERARMCERGVTLNFPSLATPPSLPSFLFYCVTFVSRSLFTVLSSLSRSQLRVRRSRAVPALGGLTQCGIPSVLAPSFYADGKRLAESQKIGVMNQSYSWPR